MTAVRVSRPPTLDGRLDDPAWTGAVPIRGFTETDPDEGKAASESTTVMLLYDADAIYVGARRSEEHTSELQSRLHLVCRLLLEKKKNTHKQRPPSFLPPVRA